MRSRGQRRFPGIVITTFKRRRVNLVEWSPLCPFPSVLLSSVLCFTTSAHHGLCLWETPSGRCQHLTLFDRFFSFIFIFINIVQPFETYFDTRYSFLLVIFPLLFFFSAPPTFARNSRRNYRKWGEGSVVQRLLRLGEEEELKSWRED